MVLKIFHADENCFSPTKLFKFINYYEKTREVHDFFLEEEDNVPETSIINSVYV